MEIQDDILSGARFGPEVERIPPYPVTNPELVALATSLARLAEARDHEPGRHIERIQYFCRMLALELAKIEEYAPFITDQFLEAIHVASAFHDIGKIAIPDAILFKPASLTPEEFAVIRTHTTIGKAYIAQASELFPQDPILRMAADIAGYHHEKWDGTGYPEGLAGREIPLAARIMAVADVYDALRSKRIYKDAYSDEISVQIIRSGRGKHFDPDIAQAFLTIHEELGMITDAMFE